MKTIFSILFLLPVLAISQIGFNTGSNELDEDLNLINNEAKKDLNFFKTNLSADFKVSVKKIDYMLSIKMEPGEVYFALEISNITGKPIDEVLKVYKANKDKGWGYIAKQLGIKPGSAAFHELKNKGKDKSNKGKSGSNGKGKSGKGKGGKGKK